MPRVFSHAESSLPLDRQRSSHPAQWRIACISVATDAAAHSAHWGPQKQLTNLPLQSSSTRWCHPKKSAPAPWRSLPVPSTQSHTPMEAMLLARYSVTKAAWLAVNLICVWVPYEWVETFGSVACTTNKSFPVHTYKKWTRRSQNSACGTTAMHGGSHRCWGNRRCSSHNASYAQKTPSIAVHPEWPPTHINLHLHVFLNGRAIPHIVQERKLPSLSRLKEHKGQHYQRRANVKQAVCLNSFIIFDDNHQRAPWITQHGSHMRSNQ